MELWIILAIIVVAGLFLVSMYNRLVTLRQRVREAWSDIDVQLKRRYDLIPNLVETVKGYAAHEKGVFESVTQARANAIAAGASGSPEQRAQAENVLTGALRSVFAVAEAYPQLQASQNFRDLQENLTATEDKIAFARRFYNGNVRDYNTGLGTFPTNILAGMFGFTAEQYFELADSKEREAPKVSFSLPSWRHQARVSISITPSQRTAGGRSRSSVRSPASSRSSATLAASTSPPAEGSRCCPRRSAFPR